MIIRYRAQALADIDEIYHYLEERGPVGAQNVLRAIYAGIHLIAELPLSSPRTDDPPASV
jgi:plasmid stabilization system protein ParE